MFFDQNTAPVNIAYAKEVNDVAILPLGAIEQHGPHCPNGLDSFNAICLAKKVAEKSGATVLPCPMYGGHPYMHMGMPATIALNYETNMALIHDIIAGASNVGYNKFILLVAHGQDSSFIPAVHKLGMEGYFTVASTWYDFLGDNKAVLSDYMWHADEAETSMALSLYGNLVHMDLAIDGGGTTLVDGKWKKAPGETSHPFQFYHFDGTFCSDGEGRSGLRRDRQSHQGQQGKGRCTGGEGRGRLQRLHQRPAGKTSCWNQSSGLPESLGLQRLQRRSLSHIRQGSRREGPAYLLQQVI